MFERIMASVHNAKIQPSTQYQFPAANKISTGKTNVVMIELKMNLPLLTKKPLKSVTSSEPHAVIWKQLLPTVPGAARPDVTIKRPAATQFLYANNDTRESAVLPNEKAGTPRRDDER